MVKYAVSCKFCKIICITRQILPTLKDFKDFKDLFFFLEKQEKGEEISARFPLSKSAIINRFVVILVILLIYLK